MEEPFVDRESGRARQPPHGPVVADIPRTATNRIETICPNPVLESA